MIICAIHSKDRLCFFCSIRISYKHKQPESYLFWVSSVRCNYIAFADRCPFPVYIRLDSISRVGGLLIYHCRGICGVSDLAQLAVRHAVDWTQCTDYTHIGRLSLHPPFGIMHLYGHYSKTKPPALTGGFLAGKAVFSMSVIRSPYGLILRTLADRSL